MKKIGLISLVLVLTMGLLGAAYASWSQTLLITEEVSTGEFCVGIRDVGTNDPGPALNEAGGMLYPTTSANGTIDPGYAKNVAAAESTNGVYKCEHETVDFYEDVTETITNGYPSYSCNITLEFANCGTVPAKGVSVNRTIDSDPDGLAKFVEITSWEIFDDGDASVASGVTVSALETAIQAYQLDPCDTMKLVIAKHILQDVGNDECPQNGTCSFVENVKWVQWND